MIRYIKAFLFKKYDHKWTGAPVDKTGLTMFKVANDLHIGSKYQDNPNALDELAALEPDGRTVLNGDIFDLSCCPKSEVNSLRALQTTFMNIYLFYFRLGNHCRRGVRASTCILPTDAGLKFGFEHGDLFGKNKNKWLEYRHKEPGAGKLKLLMTSLLDNLDHIKADRSLPDGFIEDAAQWCFDNGTDGIVCGHFHVESERRYSYLGKTIIILPAHKVNEVWL